MNEVLRELNTIKTRIPVQTYRTIVGQIHAGDMGGATVGINRLKARLRREDEQYEDRRSEQPHSKKVEE